MKLLLDTHIFIWWQQNNRKLGSTARQAITDADTVWVSAASAWEASIKVALGKLQIPGPFLHGVMANGFTPLPIGFEHADMVARLPAHHADPFDRMLIAQAIVEGATIVTHDPFFKGYAVPLLNA